MPKRPLPQLKTIVTPEGERVTFMEHPEFDKPNGGSNSIELVPPFTSGDGLNGGLIILYSKTELIQDALVVLDDGQNTTLRIVDTDYKEDFWENTYSALATILTSDPNVKIGLGAKSCAQSYSSTGMILLP